MSRISKRAAEFKAANAKSPVVHGAVIGSGGKGAYYTLKNGVVFELSRQDCAAVTPIRWDHKTVTADAFAAAFSGGDA